MLLDRVRIEQFRCLTRVDLEAGAGCNLFHGDNGSGKTSILEALYLLGRGQSFRPSGTRRLIQDGHDWCLVRAVVRSNAAAGIPIAIQKFSDTTRLRIGQERQARISDLARVCPVLVLEPGQHRLLEDGPVLRRRYLDWSVFHVEHDYHAAWQRYSRALRQRNALLRQRHGASLPVWNREFIEAAETLHGYRDTVIQELQPYIGSLLDEFLGDAHGIEVQYRRGWSSRRSLGELLDEQAEQDLERGFTQSGPQRAELRVTAGGHLARETLSRGQQKLLITALLLAQARHFIARLNTHPVLLVDDLPSELGQTARQLLFDWLLAYPGQSFLTALDVGLAPPALREQARMFHVKHGAIAPDQT